jgi:adenylate cyclase
MGKEIERKYLVTDDEYKNLANGVLIRQGFLSKNKNRVVRVRLYDDKGFLTIKGKTVGATRIEFEYEIPADDAIHMLEELCERPLIEKYRYKIKHKGFLWEVDDFIGENQGLEIAEIELNAEEQIFEKPSWIGEEVTGQPQYYNANLVNNPYSEWEK